MKKDQDRLKEQGILIYGSEEAYYKATAPDF
jgi:hypothetical protein